MDARAPSRCSTCGVVLVGGVRVADGVQAPGHVAAFERWREAVRSRDRERIAQLFAPDSRRASHQAGLEFEISGGTEQVQSLRSVYDRDSDRLMEIVAARGRWALVRAHIFGPGDADIGPWDQARIFVIELDGQGRFTHIESYDESFLDAARARFAELAE